MTDASETKRDAAPRHGEADLRPSNYEFRHWFDANPGFDLRHVDPDWRNRLRERKDELRRRGSSRFSPVGQCAHCGNWLRYHVVLEDLRDGSLIAVGEDCAANRFQVPDAQWDAFKEQLDAMRARAARGERRASVKEEFPEAAALLDELLEDYERARDEGWSPLWGNEPEWWEDKWPRFASDVALNSYRGGRLSEAQAEAVLEAVPKYRERRRRWREERENRSPAPEGRATVEGEVIKTERRKNDWGTRLVMTVRSDDGWLAWGTVPKAIRWDVDTGDRVRFDAELERSPDDEAFAFLKRPTKAEVLSGGEEEG